MAIAERAVILTLILGVVVIAIDSAGTAPLAQQFSWFVPVAMVAVIVWLIPRSVPSVAYPLAGTTDARVVTVIAAWILGAVIVALEFLIGARVASRATSSAEAPRSSP
jgi:uncharacterized membrane protein